MERSKRQQDYELEELNAFILDLQKQLNLCAHALQHACHASRITRHTSHITGTHHSSKRSRKRQLALQPLLKKRRTRWTSSGHAPRCTPQSCCSPCSLALVVKRERLKPDIHVSRTEKKALLQKWRSSLLQIER